MLIIPSQFVILYNGWCPIAGVRGVHVLIITSSEAWASTNHLIIIPLILMFVVL